MANRLVLSTLLGGIVLFVWSAIAWMVIPWPGDPLRSFTNEEAVLQTITANAPRSGNYVLPNEPKRAPGMTDEQYKATKQAAMDRMTRGPMIFTAVRLEPMGSMTKLMVIQFLTHLVLALIASFLLMQTTRRSYGRRVIFVAVCGVLIFLGGKMDEWIWWSFSNSYLLMEFGAIVIGWILAALVIAKFVIGKSSAAKAQENA
jgi:hypothetical protein